MYLSANYALGNNNNLRLTYLANSFRKKIYSSAAFSFTKNFNDIFELSAQWAIHNNSAANFGAGFTLNLGLTQFSILADNVPALFGAYNARGTTVRAGITLVSGYGEARPDFCDRDKDGVPNNEDECPSEPGSFNLRGCPDADGDGIADKFDECPLEYGALELFGCPDSDGDGVSDNKDACPDLKGSPKWEGCPDTDNDGIIDTKDDCPLLKGSALLNGCPDRDGDSIRDKDDECPDIAGEIRYGGCPDTDGDGIPDNTDECPQTAGLRKYMGCPDTDGDGLSDQHDRCPELYGEKTNRGCPSDDTDGDGVPDKIDKCPSIPGSIMHNGCPEISDLEQDVLNAAFENLEFETGKAIISESSFDSLDKLIELLKRRPDWRLLISGHTDNVGNPAINMKLSKERARAVSLYIVAGGVSAGRLEVEWFGQSKPLANNSTSAGRMKNRRVEMKVIFK
jgi:outer membrane protein OmpA-like peptidoglycan-associated protein